MHEITIPVDTGIVHTQPVILFADMQRSDRLYKAHANIIPVRLL